MPKTFSVQIDIPPSVNNLFVSGTRTKRDGSKVVTRHKSGAYEDWLKITVLKFNLQMKKVERYPVRIIVTVYGGIGFNLRRDIGNVGKPAVDALVKSGVILDDSVKYVKSESLEYVEAVRPTDIASCIVRIFEPLETS